MYTMLDLLVASFYLADAKSRRPKRIYAISNRDEQSITAQERQMSRSRLQPSLQSACKQPGLVSCTRYHFISIVLLSHQFIVRQVYNNTLMSSRAVTFPLAPNPAPAHLPTFTKSTTMGFLNGQDLRILKTSCSAWVTFQAASGPDPQRCNAAILPEGGT